MNNQTSKNMDNRKKLNPWIFIVIAVASVLIGLVIWNAVRGGESQQNTQDPVTSTMQATDSVVNTEPTETQQPNTEPIETQQPNTEPTETQQPNTEPTDPVQPTTQTPDTELPPVNSEGLENYDLGNGLVITGVGNYAGIYMEDGSNEIVSDVMMLLLENKSDRDLQLARIDIHYADVTASFQVTNLPAGEPVVLLEQSRLAVPDSAVISVECSNTVFFPEPMDVMADKFQIKGGEGFIEVTNISGQDLEGEIFVYYKKAAADLFYGGITYRVRISGGLKADVTEHLVTPNFDTEQCKVIQVTCYQ